MRWLWLIPAVGALYGLHRLMLWMEARGWIYYRRHQGGGAMASVLRDIEVHVRPQVRHVEEVQREKAETPDPGGAPPR